MFLLEILQLDNGVVVSGEAVNLGVSVQNCEVFFDFVSSLDCLNVCMVLHNTAKCRLRCKRHVKRVTSK